MRWPLTRWILSVYLLLVLAALAVATVRLSQSTEMPGLAAIELVLLAMPWSYALAIEPMSRFGVGRMTGTALVGLVLNGHILRWLAARLQRRGYGLGRAHKLKGE